MKRILILLIVLFSLAIAEEIELTTWNVANFGSVKLENTDAMNKILETLQDSDVICLQEINQIVEVRGDERNSAEVFRDLLIQKTGVTWKLVLSDTTGEGGKKERYAFLWRSGLGSLINSQIVNFNSQELATERGYFTVDFDFRGVQIKIVSLHAKASGSVAERKLQWEEIARNLSILPPTTRIFVVGDLNMEHNNAFSANFSPFLDSGLKTALKQGDLTTLKKNEVVDGVYLAKQVDYIFTKNVTVKNPEVEDFVARFFIDGNNINIIEANKVSDHLPISLKLDIPDDFPSTFKLATWRVINFSSSSRDDRELLFIKNIAQKYDFLVFQDVRDEEVIQRLADKLQESGKSYDFEVKLPYGFMWNKKFIKQIQPVRFALSGEAESFQRRPAFGFFKAGNFDFVLITHHTTTASSSARQEEIRLLKDVFTEVQGRFSSEKDIILSGCFSRPPRFSDWDDLFSISGMTTTFRKPITTTISDTDVMDNFFYIDENLDELGIVDIDKFDEEIFQNDDTEAREISTNRPCFVELHINAEDSD